MAIIPNFPQNLLDLHHNWHVPGAHPGLPSRVIPPGSPGSGLEFLTFHRNFVAQFHAWYDTQPFADQPAVAAWTFIPIELKDPAVTFWNPNLANQETRITTNTPPFATADEIGMFIENGIHNWIHGATATAFHEPEVGTFHSPQSTYFYKIHGLVDYWWQQWQQSQKQMIKDIIDSKGLLKEHKEFIKEKEHKEFIKDFKEVPEKLIKEKDKDIFEGGGQPGFGGDPAFQIGQLSQRLSRLEAAAAGGQAFIRPEERPEVGGGALVEEHPES
jgi:hypothetical protein